MQLELTEKEVQQVLNTLARQPYMEVAALIQKIITQTSEPDDADQADS